MISLVKTLNFGLKSISYIYTNKIFRSYFGKCRVSLYCIFLMIDGSTIVFFKSFELLQNNILIKFLPNSMSHIWLKKLNNLITNFFCRFKNAEKLTSSLRIDTFVSHRGLCRLVVRNAVKDDSAIYSCYLENECGSAISTILVSVVGRWEKLYQKTSQTSRNYLK